MTRTPRPVAWLGPSRGKVPKDPSFWDPPCLRLPSWQGVPLVLGEVRVLMSSGSTLASSHPGVHDMSPQKKGPVLGRVLTLIPPPEETQMVNRQTMAFCVWPLTEHALKVLPPYSRCQNVLPFEDGLDEVHCLSIHPWADTWIVPTFWLLCIHCCEYRCVIFKSLLCPFGCPSTQKWECWVTWRLFHFLKNCQTMSQWLPNQLCEGPLSSPPLTLVFFAVRCHVTVVYTETASHRSPREDQGVSASPLWQ